MAKVVKFPIKSNGVDCRNLEDLRKNWNLDEIYLVFADGRLLTWCKARHYIEAEEVEKLSKDDSKVHEKLCEIFGVEYVKPTLPPDEAEKYNKVRYFTDDEEILKKFRQVAFDRDELDDLIDDYDEIYLCKNTFEEFPIGVANKTYIGIQKAIAVIPSKKIVNFDEKNIKFVNVEFDDDYKKILEGEPLPKSDKNFELGEECEKAGAFDTAAEYYALSASDGNNDALNRFINIFRNRKIEFSPQRAVKLFEKCAESKNDKAMLQLGLIYKDGKGEIKPDESKAHHWLKEAASKGNKEAEKILNTLPTESPIKGNGYKSEVTITVKKRDGLHASLASLFVQTASKFNSKIGLKAKGKTVDAKSILMIMSLGIVNNDSVTITAEGKDSDNAVRTLANLLV